MEQQNNTSTNTMYTLSPTHVALEPVVPEPVALEPVLQEPVAPTPVVPEPVAPEHVVPEPVVVNVLNRHNIPIKTNKSQMPSYLMIISIIIILGIGVGTFMIILHKTQTTDEPVDAVVDAAITRCAPHLTTLDINNNWQCNCKYPYIVGDQGMCVIGCDPVTEQLSLNRTLCECAPTYRMSIDNKCTFIGCRNNYTRSYVCAQLCPYKNTTI
jgi:hypothetical protein